MTYKRFEDLAVWQAAMDLGVRVYKLTADSCFHQPGDLADQLRRASLSVSNNIAEGFERGTTPELLMFLYIARGSAGETRSQLRFTLCLPTHAHLRSQISDLIPVAEACSRQLQAWADSLQNSDIEGQRRLTDDVRDAFTKKRRADAFMEIIRAMNAHLQPKPEDPTA